MSGQNLKVVKLTDHDYLKQLELKIQFGHPFLIENLGEELDPALEPLLNKEVVKGMLKLGDSMIEYSTDFRLYMTTRRANPHYLPEVSTKVCLVNFMITHLGLTDQLLGQLVREEQPKLAEKKEELVLQSARNKEELTQLENEILRVISEAQAILEDEKAIQVLSQSKVKSNEIEEN